MKLKEGRVGINGSLALVSQQVHPFLLKSYLLSPYLQAWIFNATLRENILLGSPMREAWYHQVIEACALTSDLKVNNSLETIAFPAVDINIVSASEQRRYD